MKNLSLGSNFNLLPKELTAFKQWVLFRFERRGDKTTKVPYQLNGKKASTVDPSHWSSFEDVSIAFELFGDGDGIGFVFSKDDPYCGIDLDHCIHPTTKQIEPWALNWLEKFSSAYIEFSPSGAGIHIITKAKLPGKGRRKGQIEIYDQARYFTITGNAYGDFVEEIRNQQDIVEELTKEVIKGPDVDTPQPLKGNTLEELEIQEIIRKAKASKNGEKFSKLFSGEWKDLYPSQSEADQAFCNQLAFWTCCNGVAMDQIFRKSNLYREKWERFDYSMGTIRKAISFQSTRAAEDFSIQDKSPRLSESFPIIHISKIEEKIIEFQIQNLWIKNSVGFISAQPGTCKTWLAWELGFSVATGSKALGTFQTEKGKVIAFNAEDDPSRITHQRLAGIARSRNMKLENANLYLIDVPSFFLNEKDAQSKIKATITLHKPDLIILDPFRNIHTLDEDKASEISSVLNFLRELSKEHACSIMLVCHDRKSAKNDPSVRRATQTRGSNALEGWRDTAIYLDEISKEDKLVQVTVYHRGAAPPEPFYFSLNVKSDSYQKIDTVSLLKLDSCGVAASKEFGLMDKIKKLIIDNGQMDREQIRSALKKRKGDTNNAINSLIIEGILEEISLPGSRAKILKFREPNGTGIALIGSGSSPYKGGTENPLEEIR